MFGSYNGSEYTKDLLIVELEKHSVVGAVYYVHMLNQAWVITKRVM